MTSPGTMETDPKTTLPDFGRVVVPASANFTAVIQGSWLAAAAKRGAVVQRQLSFASENARQIEAIPEAFSRNVMALTTGLDAFAERVAHQAEALRTLAVSVAEQTAQVQSALENLRPITFRLPDFGAVIPRFTDLSGRLDRVLKESGFSFVLWRSDANLIVRALQVPPSQRAAFVTNLMLAETRSPAFVDELLGAVSASPLVRRRRSTIDVGVRLHLEREYEAAARVLLPEVEGLLADLLVVSRLADRDREAKLVALGKDERAVLTRRGAPKQLIGLYAKAEHAAGQEGILSEIDRQVAEFITGVLVPERNAVLHGQPLTRGQARLSTQAMFLVYALVQSVAGREGVLVPRKVAYEYRGRAVRRLSGSRAARSLALIPPGGIPSAARPAAVT